MVNSKDRLVTFAKELGFDLVAYTDPSLDQHYTSRFRDWIASGFHGEMGFLQRRVDVGIDADTLLPGARSVVVLGICYNQDASTSKTSDGRISRYAVYRDYHRIIGKRLRKIEAFIRDELNGEARGFVDTGPIQERAYAESAGMGYLGRNGMLITPDYGSWIFLACVLTTLDLDSSDADCALSCGDCRNCANACPTQAIQGDGTVDARRCISYLTIEHRGVISEELRPKLGNRVFGCDICQEVCPHNKTTKSAVDPEFFASRRLPDAIQLSELLAYGSDDAFIKRFAGTPVMRAKRLRMLRNACIAAGNSQETAILPVLRMLIKREDDKTVREHALWAIRQLEDIDG